MEKTRHFTAAVYVVNDGATALHEHEQLGLVLPPGGHVDRDETPAEAGLREVGEEIGLEATLVHDTPSVPAPNGETLPQPRHTMLYDVNVHDGVVGHQHVDFIYYATVPNRDITPQRGEAAASAWEWYTETDLRQSTIASDVVEIGTEAIQAVGSRE